MRGMGKIAVLLVLLTACAASNSPPPTPGRVGSGIQQSTTCVPPLNPVTVPDAGIVVYDTTVQQGFKSDRVTVSCRYDQPVTILFQGKRFGSSTWRTLNGAGGAPAGESVSANTDTFKDYLVQTSNSRVKIVTGSTAPSTTVETDICLPFERSLGQ